MKGWLKQRGFKTLTPEYPTVEIGTFAVLMALAAWSWKNPNGAWRSLSTLKSNLINEIRLGNGHRSLEVDTVACKRLVKGHSVFSKHDPSKHFGFTLAHGLAAIEFIANGRKPEECTILETGLMAAIALVTRTGCRRGEIFPDKVTDPKLLKVGYMTTGTLKKGTYKGIKSTLGTVRQIMQKQRYGVIHLHFVKHRALKGKIPMIISTQEKTELNFWTLWSAHAKKRLEANEIGFSGFSPMFAAGVRHGHPDPLLKKHWTGIMGKNKPLRKYMEKLFPGDWSKFTPNSPRYGFLAALFRTLAKHPTLAPPWVAIELMHHQPSITIQNYCLQSPAVLANIQDHLFRDSWAEYQEAIAFIHGLETEAKETNSEKEQPSAEPTKNEGPIYNTKMDLHTPPRKKARVKRRFSNAKPKTHNTRSATKNTNSEKTKQNKSSKKRGRKGNTIQSKAKTETEPETPFTTTDPKETTSSKTMQNGTRKSSRARKPKNFGPDFVADWDSDPDFEIPDEVLLANANEDDWDDGSQGLHFPTPPRPRSRIED